jgi:LEA14-like dessication related protein
MKRVIVLIVVIAVLVIAGLFWWKSPATRESRNNAKKKVLPQIEMANLQITDMDKEKVSLIANLIIRNPLPADLNAQNLRYKIMIDSVKVIETRYDKNVTVRSNDSAVISVPNVI